MFTVTSSSQLINSLANYHCYRSLHHQQIWIRYDVVYEILRVIFFILLQVMGHAVALRDFDISTSIDRTKGPPSPHLLVSGRHSGIARFALADVSQREVDKRQSPVKTLLMNITGLRASHIVVHRNHHARHLLERTNWASEIAER